MITAPTPFNKQAPFLEVLVQGKVREVNSPQNSEYTYYELALKSSDEYSLPPILQISQSSSDRPFARKGEIVTLKCTVGGYTRRSNGISYVTNTLTFVEVVS